MNKAIIFAILLALTFSLKLDHQTGEWNVVGADSSIDQFIRNSFPGLNGANLVQAKSQVVAGTNYEYTYEKDSNRWVITVFDQSWTNTRQVTSVIRSQNSNEAGKQIQRIFTTSQDSRDFTTIARNQVV